jgi:hypothetical protein
MDAFLQTQVASLRVYVLHVHMYVCSVLSPAEQVWQVACQPAQSCVNTCHIDWFKRGAFALKVAADLWFRQDFSSEYRGSTADACERVYEAFCGFGKLGDVLFAENGVTIASGQESGVFTQQDAHVCVCPVCMYTNVIAMCQCLSLMCVQVLIRTYSCICICMQVFILCIQIKELAAMLLRFKNKHGNVQKALGIFRKYAGQVPPGKTKMIPANISEMTDQLLLDVGSL